MAGKYSSLANPEKGDFEVLLVQNLTEKMKSVSEESKLVAELIPTPSKPLNSRRGFQTRSGAPKKGNQGKKNSRNARSQAYRRKKGKTSRGPAPQRDGSQNQKKQ